MQIKILQIQKAKVQNLKVRIRISLAIFFYYTEKIATYSNPNVINNY